MKDIFKIFQFQEDTEAGLYGDFKRIITHVQSSSLYHDALCSFFLNEKSLPVLLMLNLPTILSIFQQ